MKVIIDLCVVPLGAGTRVDREQSMQDKLDSVEDKFEIPR